jgi:hypothetical protein
LKRKGSLMPGREPEVLVETVEDSDSGSEGEPDALDRDKVLRHNWDDNPGGEALQRNNVLPPKGKKVSKGCGAAWCVALEIGTGKRSPLSVTRTDVQQITKMEVERRIGGKIGPPIRSMDTRIRQARAEAQHQEPFIRPMPDRGGGMLPPEGV